MTLNELLVLTNTFLKQEIYDEEITALLNLAQNNFARDTHIIKRDVDINALTGEQSWDISSLGILKVHNIIIGDDLYLYKASRDFLDLNWPNWLSTPNSSQPTYWVEFDGKIYTNTPLLEDDTIHVVASFLPENVLSLDDLSASPELPEEYHIALVWDTLAMMSSGKDDSSGQYLDRYMTLVSGAQSAGRYAHNRVRNKNEYF